MMTPPHAYVPGQTARHPDGAFDPIRNSAHAGASTQELAQSAAFQTGLRYLDEGFFWEAHEVLEPVWMALPVGSDARRLVQALIQFANAQLKLRMRRPKAALRLCAIVRGLLAEIAAAEVMAVKRAGLSARLDRFESHVRDVHDNA